MGLGFHLLSQLIFDIPFASIWLCYAAFVDWRPLVRRVLPRFRGEPNPADAPVVDDPRPNAALVVGAVLLVLAVVQGARGQMQSYPFACYPTFEWRAADRMPDLIITVVEANGREVEIPHGRNAAGYRTQRKWAEIWGLAGITVGLSRERLAAYYRAEVEPVVRRRNSKAASVRFYRVDRAVVPEEHGRPVASRLLFELVL
jgi:hypothetical protein